MPFLESQSATDYNDALDKIEAFVTNRTVAAIAVAAGGAGYVVGDLLTITGGTLQTLVNQACQVVVTGETAGVIDTVRFSQSGAYTVDPASPAGHTGGTGAGATFTLTMADVGWTRRRRTQEAVSAVVPTGIDPGGSGYTVGDDIAVSGGVDVPASAVFNVDTLGAGSATIAAAGAGYTNGAQVLTLVGGTFTIAAQFNVTVAGGVVTSVDSVAVVGEYTVFPGSPVATSGGGGAGATLTVVFDGVSTVSLVDVGEYGETPANPAASSGGTGAGATLTVTYQDFVGDFDLMLEGVGSGSDEIFIGFRTFQIGAAFNWELAGFTGYDPLQSYGAQPGISPGRFDLAGTDAEGCYVPLDNSALTFWIYANGRRLVADFKVGASTYTNMHSGFLNPAGTGSEFPYPLMIEGTSSNPSTLFSSTAIGYSGLVDPISALNQNTGPCLYRDPAGVWNTIRNSNQTSLGRNARDEFVIWPASSPGTLGLSTDDIVSPGNNISTDLIPNTGVPGTPSQFLKQTPDSPDDVSLLWPTMIIREGNGSNLARDVHGEMEGVFWATADISGLPATAVSEDEFQNGGRRFRIFQNGNRTENTTFVLIEEA